MRFTANNNLAEMRRIRCMCDFICLPDRFLNRMHQMKQNIAQRLVFQVTQQICVKPMKFLMRRPWFFTNERLTLPTGVCRLKKVSVAAYVLTLVFFFISLFPE
jgi:hypothetical protein